MPKMPTTSHKIFETNSMLASGEGVHNGEKNLFFKSFLLFLTKLSLWQENWALGYYC